jgi:hypothetical protein
MNRTEPQSYQDFDSLPARVAGVFRSPRALFKTFIVRPRWADVMVLSLAISLACGIGLMLTAVGRQALADRLERTALAFGREVDDAQYTRFQEVSENGVAYATLQALAAGPVLTFGGAMVIFVVFTMVGGGTARFQQVLAVTAHAGVILALREVVAAPVSYSRETLASPATLTMIAPMLDEASPAARFLGAVDLFVIWWLVALALGVALLYDRPARATTAAFVGAYLGFAALLAIAMIVSGGTV